MKDNQKKKKLPLAVENFDHKLPENCNCRSVSLSALFSEVRSKIVVIRQEKVIADADVAALYGVETKRVNETVRNNPEKFPDE